VTDRSARLPSHNILATLPGEAPVDVQWNTLEGLRVDAELLLWHGAQGAVTAPETKLLRAMQLARSKSAPSWELRAATSFARLLRDQGYAADAVAILRLVYSRFPEGFNTADLRGAKPLLKDLGWRVGAVIVLARAAGRDRVVGGGYRVTATAWTAVAPTKVLRAALPAAWSISLCLGSGFGEILSVFCFAVVAIAWTVIDLRGGIHPNLAGHGIIDILSSRRTSRGA
jgi:hypothetical protein